MEEAGASKGSPDVSPARVGSAATPVSPRGALNPGLDLQIKTRKGVVLMDWVRATLTAAGKAYRRYLVVGLGADRS